MSGRSEDAKDSNSSSLRGRFHAYLLKNLPAFGIALIVALIGFVAIVTSGQYATAGVAVLNGLGAAVAFGLITFLIARVFLGYVRFMRSRIDRNSNSYKMESGGNVSSESAQSQHIADRSDVVLGEKYDVVSGEGGSVEYAFSFDSLHSWVRSVAADYWKNGHYRDAVEHAARSVNSQTQKLVWTYKDGTDLMNYVFSADPPKQGDGRKLRFRGDPRTDTWKNRMQAAQSLGRACFMGLRNLAAHEQTLDWQQELAFQYLVMFSVLAQWIEECDPTGV